MKTIIKLYSNGNIYCEKDLLKSNSDDRYSFGNQGIFVPEIVELPPNNYRNYYVEKTTELGYVVAWEGEDIPIGGIQKAFPDYRVSDFIDIRGWQQITINVRFEGMDQQNGFVGIYFYTEDKVFSWYDGTSANIPIREFYQYKSNVFAPFVRLATNYHYKNGAKVKISVERDNVNSDKHYPSYQDMPGWVKDTGNPISFFKEGIVIKGSLLNNSN